MEHRAGRLPEAILHAPTKWRKDPVRRAAAEWVEELGRKDAGWSALLASEDSEEGSLVRVSDSLSFAFAPDHYFDRSCFLDTHVVAMSRPILNERLLSDITAFQRFLQTAWPEPESADAPEIAAASNPLEIASFLRGIGLTDAADRIEQLVEYADEDPDETPLNMDSLRDLARWLVQESVLLDPTVGVDHDGLLTAEWRVLPNGGLIMRFAPGDQIHYAGVVNVRGSGTYESIKGTSPKPKALELIRKFAEGLEIQ